jgi:hypothetical protein
MKILPLQTLPASRRIERRHNPSATSGRYGYREYRACLRWEFGFTCAFCLLHEGDLADLGVRGLGLTWIEHFRPAALTPERINEYENCFYACLFCNRSRGAAPPVDAAGRSLINPCGQAWAERFRPSDDGRLLPREADPDAAYTEEAYDLNDPRKVRRRNLRRERLEEWLTLLREGPLHIRSLVGLSESAGSLEEARTLLDSASTLRSGILRAWIEIQRYAAIPADADAVCACGREDHHVLAGWLAAQTQELESAE